MENSYLNPLLVPTTKHFESWLKLAKSKSGQPEFRLEKSMTKANLNKISAKHKSNKLLEKTAEKYVNLFFVQSCQTSFPFSL